ncbi:hypothetical protein mhp420 [Mesomycoplasma hyopneumoniae 232]|uniref:Uncharacterized protein n=1 Tax=Mesomycoplasma hyopneumoniae (strain 232) TaxID=295358 RepID=Q600N5_MESH2|nr:hypothetical protein mhp420 [Mesomycoplasma hyopneumoniae 232]
MINRKINQFFPIFSFFKVFLQKILILVETKQPKGSKKCKSINSEKLSQKTKTI